MAGVEGLEPPTPGFGDRCSDQLSYTPRRPGLHIGPEQACCLVGRRSAVKPFVTSIGQRAAPAGARRRAARSPRATTDRTARPDLRDRTRRRESRGDRAASSARSSAAGRSARTARARSSPCVERSASRRARWMDRRPISFDDRRLAHAPDRGACRLSPAPARDRRRSGARRRAFQREEPGVARRRALQSRVSSAEGPKITR